MFSKHPNGLIAAALANKGEMCIRDRTGTVSIKVYGSACALQAVYRHKESFVILSLIHIC